MVIACVVATADHRGHTAVSRDLIRVKSLAASNATSAWIADRQNGSMCRTQIGELLFGARSTMSACVGRQAFLMRV